MEMTQFAEAGAGHAPDLSEDTGPVDLVDCVFQVHGKVTAGSVIGIVIKPTSNCVDDGLANVFGR